MPVLHSSIAKTIFVLFILASDLGIEIAIPLLIGLAIVISTPVLVVLKKHDAKGLAFVLLVLLCTLAGSFFINDLANRKYWDVAKDVVVFLKYPLLLLLVLIIKKSLSSDSLIRLYILYASFFAVVYVVLLPVFYITGVLDLKSVDSFGKTAPFVTYAFAIAPSIMYLYRQYFSAGPFWLLIVVTFATTERRLWLVLISAVIIAWLMRANFQKKLMGLFALLCFVGFSIYLGDSGNRYSLQGALHEVYGTEFQNQFEIKDRWRAYELFMGISALAKSDSAHWIFGLGPGYFVDLGLGTIKWGDGTWTGIPAFHNGYLFPLVKTGLIGLGLFLVLIYFFGWKSRGDDWLVMRRYLSLSLLATTGVEFGIFSQGNCNVFLFLIFWFWVKCGKESTNSDGWGVQKTIKLDLATTAVPQPMKNL